MSRRSYKAALRAKGIKPIPSYSSLRTRKDTPGEHHEIVTPLRELRPTAPLLSIGGRLVQLVRMVQP